MNLRPDKLDNIIGQDNVKERLKICIDAVRSTGQPFPHTLFFGPPGTGKTTLARAMATELNKEIVIGNGANINSIKALLPYLMSTTEGSILFIDEIHRLPVKVAECLYLAIEDFRVDLANEHCQPIELPRFTFVGATTNAGLIPAPLYDRFVLKLPLELYTTEQLVDIITLSADKLNLNLADEAKEIVATSSRNTPRIANNRLLWIQSYSISKGLNVVTKDHIIDALKLEGVNKYGVDKSDIKYLSMLKRHQPAGINTLVSVTNIDKETITETIEPFLLRNNLIQKTTKGRILCSSQ